MPEREVVPVGFETLYFSFHPGDLVISPGTLSIRVNGRHVDLLSEHVNLFRREWQDVEIPLSAFDSCTVE